MCSTLRNGRAQAASITGSPRCRSDHSQVRAGSSSMTGIGIVRSSRTSRSSPGEPSERKGSAVVASFACQRSRSVSAEMDTTRSIIDAFPSGASSAAAAERRSPGHEEQPGDDAVDRELARRSP